jgi:hypothetical protein
MDKVAEQDLIIRTLKGGQFIRERHGSLFDRGSADSYYHRPRDPHWYPNGTGAKPRIVELTPAEIEEYNAGYDYNEQYGDKKDWS